MRAFCKRDAWSRYLLSKKTYFNHPVPVYRPRERKRGEGWLAGGALPFAAAPEEKPRSFICFSSGAAPQMTLVGLEGETHPWGFGEEVRHEPHKRGGGKARESRMED